jgi:PPK2 family polyphosphate:nucleotide phosphotransferase
MAKRGNAVLSITRAGQVPKLTEKLAQATPLLSGDKSEDKECDLKRLSKLAQKIDALQDLLWANQNKRLLLVLQGMDTSGKDGTVRFVFAHTSPLGVRLASFKAPTEEERARDFLWRVHAQVPRAGEIVIFNRSHYEDLLVPGVNGWLTKDEFKARAKQVVEFEAMLASSGTTVLKCMLHISKAEQARRLQERIDDPAKHWKFSMGDVEVRKQWDAYQRCYERVLGLTATKTAPWHVVSADSKLHRNLCIAELVLEALQAMKLKSPKANPAYVGLKIE